MLDTKLQQNPYVPQIYSDSETVNEVEEVTEPVAAYSRYQGKTIQVVALPYDAYTVIDCDEQVSSAEVDEVSLDPRLVARVRTERGIQLVFQGRVQDYVRYQDSQYAEISAQRKAWTMRTHSLDGSKPRTLLLLEAVTGLQEAWIEGGGCTRHSFLLQRRIVLSAGTGPTGLPPTRRVVRDGSS